MAEKQTMKSGNFSSARKRKNAVKVQIFTWR